VEVYAVAAGNAAVEEMPPEMLGREIDSAADTEFAGDTPVAGDIPVVGGIGAVAGGMETVAGGIGCIGCSCLEFERSLQCNVGSFL